MDRHRAGWRPPATRLGQLGAPAGGRVLAVAVRLAADRAADVHDLLEARHDLLQAGDTKDAAEVTEGICLQLQTWSTSEQDGALIHDALARLPADSPRRAA